MSLLRPTVILVARDCFDTGIGEDLKDLGVITESALGPLPCLLCFRLVHSLLRPHQNCHTCGVHSSVIYRPFFSVRFKKSENKSAVCKRLLLELSDTVHTENRWAVVALTENNYLPAESRIDEARLDRRFPGQQLYSPSALRKMTFGSSLSGFRE